jgi:hypothetical protein
MKKRIKKIVLSVIVVLALSLQIFSFSVSAYTHPFEAIDAFGDWVVGNKTFGEFADIFEDAVDIFGVIPEQNPQYEFNPEFFRRFAESVGVDADGAFDEYVTNGGLNHEGGGRGGRRYRYYVKTNDPPSTPASASYDRRTIRMWYFNAVSDNVSFPIVRYNGYYTINTRSVAIADWAVYEKKYGEEFELVSMGIGVMPVEHPAQLSYRFYFEPHSNGVRYTTYYVEEHNLPLVWPSGTEDINPPSIDYPVDGGIDNNPSLDYITEAELIAFIDYLLANMPQDPPPSETDLSGVENILNAILRKINELSGNPEFEWPPMPEFKWPEPPELVWPEMPEFEWPPMPEFEWPKLPKLPEIIDNTPILVEIRDILSGNNGNGGTEKEIAGTLHNVLVYENTTLEDIGDFIFNHDESGNLKVQYDGDPYWLEPDGTLEYPEGSGTYYYVDMNYMYIADSSTNKIKNTIFNINIDTFFGVDVDFNMTIEEFNVNMGTIKTDWENKFEFIPNIKKFLDEAFEAITGQKLDIYEEKKKDDSGFSLFRASPVSMSAAPSRAGAQSAAADFSNYDNTPASFAEALASVEIPFDFSHFDSVLPDVRALIGFLLLAKSIFSKFKALPTVIGQVASFAGNSDSGPNYTSITHYYMG